MPDDEVEAGRFDRPGMMDMGGMDMNHGSVPGPGRARDLRREAEDFFADVAAPVPAAPVPGDATQPPALESPSGDAAPTAASQARGGKRFASDFSLMGADASSSEDLAMDGMEAHRAVAGVRTLLPLNLDLRAWIDSDIGARGSLEKHLPLTPRLAISGAVRYDTHDHWEGNAGLAFMFSQGVSLLARWHSTFGFGGGVETRF